MRSSSFQVSMVTRTVVFWERHLWGLHKTHHLHLQSVTRKNAIHLMYGPEGNSFVFPRVLMFLETKSRETSGLEGKQN